MTSRPSPWHSLPAACSACFSLAASGGPSRRGSRPTLPAFWFLGSLLLRTGAILAGFYLVSQGHWSRLVACLLGFVIARVIVVKRLTRAPADQTPLEEETTIALTPDDLVFWRYGFFDSIARSSPHGA